MLACRQYYSDFTGDIIARMLIVFGSL